MLVIQCSDFASYTLYSHGSNLVLRCAFYSFDINAGILKFRLVGEFVDEFE